MTLFAVWFDMSRNLLQYVFWNLRISLLTAQVKQCSFILIFELKMLSLIQQIYLNHILL